jgi:hypothetical protein
LPEKRVIRDDVNSRGLCRQVLVVRCPGYFEVCCGSVLILISGISAKSAVKRLDFSIGGFNGNQLLRSRCAIQSQVRLHLSKSAKKKFITWN